jgi:hypothetical protein
MSIKFKRTKIDVQYVRNEPKIYQESNAFVTI